MIDTKWIWPTVYLWLGYFYGLVSNFNMFLIFNIIMMLALIYVIRYLNKLGVNND